MGRRTDTIACLGFSRGSTVPALRWLEGGEIFHAFAVANGGTCEGEPGPRDGYPNPDVHTAYARDPFGNKLEVIFNGFAA